MDCLWCTYIFDYSFLGCRELSVYLLSILAKMRTIYKIVLKAVFIVVMLIAFNYIYKYFFYEADIQKHSEVINMVRAVPHDAEIIYVGESSNNTYRGDDNDKRKISEFIADYYPGLKFHDITKPAAHAGIYRVLLENISDSSKVKTVIVTLNLRSFSGQWIYSDMETPLQKSMVLIRKYPPLVNRFLLSFKAYDIKTKKEREAQFKRKWRKDKFKFPYEFPYRDVRKWDGHMFHNGIKKPDGTKDYKLTELACHYIKGYGFQIDTLTNPRIADFNDIVELAKKRGWRLVFNLMAENTKKAKEMVGDDLIFVMEQNRKLLIDYYGRQGVTVIDNLNAVDDEQFIDQHWTTEHYAENGRKTVAKNVAIGLKEFYPGECIDSVMY